MRPLERVNIKKSDFLFGIVVAAIASLAASSLANYLTQRDLKSLIVSIVCIITVISYFAFIIIKFKSVSISTESILVMSQKGELIKLFHYDFNKRLCNAINAALNENPAFKERWNCSFGEDKQDMVSEKTKEMIDQLKKTSLHDKLFLTAIETAAVTPDASFLIIDAVEFEFIDWLSVLLCDKYNKTSDKPEKINRENISSYLQKNKILELLSRDLQDRPAFSDVKIDKKYLDCIYSVTDIKTKAEFHKFELLFPHKTIIDRDSKGVLNIKNKFFTLKFSCGFNSTNGVLPSGYPELILKCSHKDINAYNINISLVLDFNLWHFLFSENRKKYNWIDDFADMFEKYFSFNEYINRIGYETARTMFKIIQKTSNTTDKCN